MHNIKYTVLNVKLKFKEKCSLSEFRSLTFGGAIINQFIKLYCINNRQCLSCSNVKKCVVQRLLGGSFDANLPLICSSSKSYPLYLIKFCSEKRYFDENDILELNVLLLEEAVNYISQFVYIFDILGDIGIGLNKSKYILEGIHNEFDSPVFENGVIYEHNLIVRNIEEYINQRKSHITKFKKLNFETSFELEKVDEKSFEITVNNLISSIIKRLKSLNILEESECEKLSENIIKNLQIENFNVKMGIKNYNLNKENQIVKLKNNLGEIIISLKNNIYIDYFLIGELVHIGKNILLGFGNYVLEEE